MFLRFFQYISLLIGCISTKHGGQKKYITATFCLYDSVTLTPPGHPLPLIQGYYLLKT